MELQGARAIVTGGASGIGAACVAQLRAAGARVVPVLSADAYAALSAYRFSGNVRELAHAIEHAVVLEGDGEITLDHLPAAIAEAAPANVAAPVVREPTNGSPPALVAPLVAAARAFEKGHLRRALAATGGKRVKAAEMLGISRKSLWEKLRMYDLEEAAGTPAPAPRAPSA